MSSTKNAKDKGKLARQNSAIDAVIGYNLRRLRKEHGLSQENLAQKIGVTFQQIQKYENGKNRIALSTAYKISKAFDCSILQFFEGLDVIDYENMKNWDSNSLIKEMVARIGQVNE